MPRPLRHVGTGSTRAAMFMLAALSALPACYTGLSGAAVTDADETRGDGDGDGASADASESGDETGAQPPEDAAQVAAIGLRRLTSHEYDNTLRDLIGDDSRSSNLLLPEDLRTPFDNDYTVQAPSQALIEGAELLAADAAARLVADATRRDAVIGCTPTGPDDAACFESFVRGFGRRALRRPLDEDEVAAYLAFAADGIESNDFDAGVESVVRAMLQAPSFLYRVEIGTPVDGEPGLSRLDDYELATRLSYLLWGSTPSETLLDRAEAGELGDAAAIREIAAEMLEDPRAVDRIARFHALWIGYERLPFDYELAAAMEAETRALMKRVIFDERLPWQELFRFSQTFVDATLATHYGLTPPDGDAPAWIDYGDSGRAGLLSHGSFLSVGAKFGDTSPTQRGLLVQTRLFCTDIPPPPPDPDINVDEPPGDPETQCKSEQYAAHAVPGSGCAGCHAQIDPIGFGLENYDQQGRWRDHDVDKPQCVIAGQGEVAGVGSFSGPAELGELAIASGRLERCVATQLYRFTIGRYELGEVDLRFIDLLMERMGEGELPFDTLVGELVASDTFRFRRQEEG